MAVDVKIQVTRSSCMDHAAGQPLRGQLGGEGIATTTNFTNDQVARDNSGCKVRRSYRCIFNKLFVNPAEGDFHIQSAMQKQCCWCW